LPSSSFPLLLVFTWYRARSPRDAVRTAAVAAVAFALPMVLTVGPFLLIDAGAFLHDVLAYLTSALPIGGFGLGGLLVAPCRRPGCPLQLCAPRTGGLILAYWFGLRAFAPSDLGQSPATLATITWRLHHARLCVPALSSVRLRGA